jgi:DNA-binding Lrp family transcriptional regulator
MCGNRVTAVVEVKITPERGGGFDRLASRIARFAEVQSCYLMSGGYDLLVVAEGTTLQEIASFIAEKLSTIKGVISTATHFRLKAYKENGVSLTRDTKSERLAVTP